MKIITIFLFAFLVFVVSTTQAQVGIGTTTPAGSAQLDISSTTKVLLLPRMSHIQGNAIANPVAGLMIWCNN